MSITLSCAYIHDSFSCFLMAATQGMQIQGSRPSSRWSKTHFENGHSSVLKDNTRHKLLFLTCFLLRKNITIYNNNNVDPMLNLDSRLMAGDSPRWECADSPLLASSAKCRTVNCEALSVLSISSSDPIQPFCDFALMLTWMSHDSPGQRSPEPVRQSRYACPTLHWQNLYELVSIWIWIFMNWIELNICMSLWVWESFHEF